MELCDLISVLKPKDVYLSTVNFGLEKTSPCEAFLTPFALEMSSNTIERGHQCRNQVCDTTPYFRQCPRLEVPNLTIALTIIGASYPK